MWALFIVYTSKLLCNHIYQYAMLSESIALKFLSDQTNSLRIINEKQGNVASEIHNIGYLLYKVY